MKTSKLSPALTCAFICIISISAHAFVIKPIDKFTLDIEPIIPKEYIDPDSLGITVRYEIEEATLMPDNENMVDFRLYIPGFGMTSDGHAPYLPVRMDSFDLPEWSDSAIINIEKVSYTDYFTTPQSTTKNNRINVSQLDTIHTSNTNITHNIVSLARIETRRHTSIAKIMIEPALYNPTTGKISVAGTFQYRINFIASPNRQKKAARPGISNTQIWDIDSLPPEITPPIHQSNPFGYEILNDGYVIITTPKYKEAAEIFAEHKKTLGFTVKIFYRDTWNDNEVTDSLSNYYNDNPALKYALIIGQHNDVPGKILTKFWNEGEVSDFYYACLDGPGDTRRDIYMGRISASFPDDAITAVRKIIEYEMYPPSSQAFYNCGVHTSHFSAMPDLKTEGSLSVQTCEIIRNHVMTHGKSVRRVYTLSEGADPKKWNSFSGAGGNVPEDLYPENYNWDNNGMDVVKAVNDGCFYLLYTGHGDYTEWLNPHLNTAYIKFLLKNGDLQPIVFSMTCNSGNFSKSSVAEAFLTNQRGGGVGVFAATGLIDSRDTPMTTFGMFNMIWPEPGLYTIYNAFLGDYVLTKYRHPRYRLGEILEAGCDRLEELMPWERSTSTRKILEDMHVFGDASMMIRTQVPKEFDDTEVSISCHRLGNNAQHDIHIQVNTLESVYIGIYNKKTNSSELLTGSEIKFSILNVDDLMKDNSLSICVYGANRIPKLFDFHNTTTSNKPLGTYQLTAVSNRESSYITLCLHGDPTPECDMLLYLVDVKTGNIALKTHITFQSGKSLLDVAKIPDGQYAVTVSDGNIVKGQTQIMIHH